jgi:hypothetical protein
MRSDKELPLGNNVFCMDSTCFVICCPFHPSTATLPFTSTDFVRRFYPTRVRA